jgi:hypothetical protein
LLEKGHRTGAVTAAGAAGVDGLGVATDWTEALPGPDGVAPFSSPWVEGTRYVVAEIDAVICGNPLGAAPRLIAFRLISRPLTFTCLFVATTNRWRRPRKSARWKKLPLNVNVNG